MKKYYHKLTKEEIDKALSSYENYEDFARDYPQPLWCTYPEATAGVMGCWSLISGYVTSRNYCKQCDCYKLKG